MILALPPTPTGGRVPALRPSAPSRTDSKQVAVGPSAAPLYQISGRLVGRPSIGAGMIALGGAAVVAENRSSRAAVAFTNTTANGDWSLNVTPGPYYVYSNRTTSGGVAFGGDTVGVTVVRANLTGYTLIAYPFVGFNNRTFVLPAWNNLTVYAWNCNGNPPCGSGPSTQQPLTSWTQDGVFYVNSTDRLVFYSFANGTVTNLAPWLPLYDNWMYYEGVENTEWITQDGTYVYELGCWNNCTAHAPLSFYAVNVSTGRTWFHNFTGVTASRTYLNGQVNLVGVGGNDSTAMVIVQDGQAYAWNLWNATQWRLKMRLPYFEANNAYWVPALDSFIDVEAGGRTSDRVVQYRLNPAGQMTNVSWLRYHGASRYIVNGVDGLVFNVTSRELLFTSAVSSIPENLLTVAIHVGPSGRMSSIGSTWGGTNLTFYPNASAYPTVSSGEHRPIPYAQGPVESVVSDARFHNDSFLVEPTENFWYDTNESPYTRAQCGVACYSLNVYVASPAALEGVFWNTSYLLPPSSLDCRHNGSACPIRGTMASFAPGTVQWLWRVGATPLPYPSTAAIAQTVGPGAPSVTVVRTNTTMTFQWSPPTTGQNPIVNYTLLWGATRAYGHSENFYPENRSFTLSGLAPHTRYFYRFYATNLHGPGTPVTRSQLTLHPGPVRAHAEAGTGAMVGPTGRLPGIEPPGGPGWCELTAPPLGAPSFGRALPGTQTLWPSRDDARDRPIARRTLTEVGTS